MRLYISQDLLDLPSLGAIAAAWTTATSALAPVLFASTASIGVRAVEVLNALHPCTAAVVIGVGWSGVATAVACGSWWAT